MATKYSFLILVRSLVFTLLGGMFFLQSATAQVVDIQIDLDPIFTLRELAETEYSTEIMAFSDNLTWIEIESKANIFITICYETTYDHVEIYYLNKGKFTPGDAKLLEGTNSGFNLLHVPLPDKKIKTYRAWIAYPKHKLNSITLDYQ